MGARILILDDPGRDVLRPILGLWTVVETDGGGFMLGGPGVDERTSVDGQTTFDSLLQALSSPEHRSLGAPDRCPPSVLDTIVRRA
ncbi:MAG: hypothetical protein R2701_05665 [Acidimicrobiales bacterium]